MTVLTLVSHLMNSCNQNKPPAVLLQHDDQSPATADAGEIQADPSLGVSATSASSSLTLMKHP